MNSNVLPTSMLIHYFTNLKYLFCCFQIPTERHMFYIIILAYGTQRSQSQVMLWTNSWTTNVNRISEIAVKLMYKYNSDNLFCNSQNHYQKCPLIRWVSMQWITKQNNQQSIILPYQPQEMIDDILVEREMTSACIPDRSAPLFIYSHNKHM